VGNRDAFFEGLTATQKRAAIARELYLKTRKASWHGPVERRDPKTYRGRSDVVQRCQNPYCREYPPAGSRASGRCLVCNTPLLR
jgi:hypothetical protein